MSKFTPGEWMVCRNPAWGANVDIRSNNKSVAFVSSMSESDAHLIAAAPKMYGALKAVIDNELGCGGCMACDITPGEDCPLRMVKEAIAQAEGGRDE